MILDRSILPLEIEEPLSDLLKSGDPIYLVGGAIRDFLTNREIHDLDFVLVDKAKSFARNVADQIGGNFYMLDENRQTARVLWKTSDGKSYTLDFATQQGDSIEVDLLRRDFTINAMAIDQKDPGHLIDPLGGAQNLKDKILRHCDEDSIQDDPIRALRGARLAVQFGLTIEKQTRDSISQAANLLQAVSAERMRDEIFRILEGPKTAAAIHLMVFLGLFEPVFPNLFPQFSDQKSSISFRNKWDLTLACLDNLETIIGSLSTDPQNIRITDQNSKLMIQKLGKYHRHFGEHFREMPTISRTRRSLLFLAAVYHLSEPQQELENPVSLKGKINTPELILERARQLALSNEELSILNKIVSHQKWVNQIRKSSPKDYPRLIHRFFRECGEEGVDICLIELADFLAYAGVKVKQDEWLGEIETCRMLLEAWWEHREDQIFPHRLISGDDMIQELGLLFGPRIGEILDAVYEAQAVGEVTDRETAMALARRLAQENQEK